MELHDRLPPEVADRRVVEQLQARRRDGRTMFERLLPVFQDEAAQTLRDIRLATESRDSESVRLAAHKLKGSASVLGSLQVKELSQQIMDIARNGSLPEAATLGALEAAVGRFCAYAVSLTR